MTEPTDTSRICSENTRRAVRQRVRAGVAGVLLATLGVAASAQVYLGGSVGGQIAPGVYGRVDLGGAPPPPVIYQQPVIIAPPRVVVPAEPVYMYVPPGHAKHWGKHCARYGACGQNVYFLRNPPPQFHRGPPPRHARDRDDRWDRRDRDDRYDRHDHRDYRRDRDDRDDYRGNGHGHGRGHGRD
ncbi:hypothetical protein [Diaphorobacter aerolatus]|uniref:Uncharacterized protein n=1 Tax=Diaphorobacter aerolatus TaxID=1288495 RepID=A0A7H0GKL5_9BURK|nr:hypothetical protein [Diaphorobacter aerolatus]QNP48831.1 hypothetical protein H9K75_01005 [Diaphorobacter aerolatus]